MLYVDFNMVAGNKRTTIIRQLLPTTLRASGAPPRAFLLDAGTCVSYTRAIHNPYGVIHYITHVCGRTTSSSSISHTFNGSTLGYYLLVLFFQKKSTQKKHVVVLLSALIIVCVNSFLERKNQRTISSSNSPPKRGNYYYTYY